VQDGSEGSDVADAAAAGGAEEEDLDAILRELNLQVRWSAAGVQPEGVAPSLPPCLQLFPRSWLAAAAQLGPGRCFPCCSLPRLAPSSRSSRRLAAAAGHCLR
jgi:hypothetical protein